MLPSILAGEHAFEVRAQPRRRPTPSRPARPGGSSSRRPPSARPTRPPPRPETQATTRRRRRDDARLATPPSSSTRAPTRSRRTSTPDAIEPSARGGPARQGAAPQRQRRSTASASRSSTTRSSAAPPRAPTAASRSPSTAAAPLTLAFEREGYVPSQRQLEVPTQEYEARPGDRAGPLRGPRHRRRPDRRRPAGRARLGDHRRRRHAPRHAAARARHRGHRDAPRRHREGARRPAEHPRHRVHDRRQRPGRDAGRAAADVAPTRTPSSTPSTRPPSDEAVDVEFDKPVVTYVDNFVGFTAGTPVPMGYYDREKAQWIAAPDGIVIKILAEQSGRAQLDVTGDDVADTQLARSASTTPSWRKLADLYAPGKSLWRAAITHFTPWDYNWPYGLPDGAGGPDQGGPDDGDPDGDDPCRAGRLDHHLRGPGARRAGRDRRHPVHARLPVRPGPRPPHRRRARDPADGRQPARLGRAHRPHDRGRRAHDHALVQPRAEPPDEFIFDGLDAYGRAVQGRQKVDVRIDYVYPAVYRSPGSFSSSFAAIGGAVLCANRTRQEINVSQKLERRRRRAHRAAGRARGLEHRRPPHLRPGRPHALHGRRHQAQRRGPELRRHLDDEVRARVPGGHRDHAGGRRVRGRFERARRAPDRARTAPRP